MAWGIDMIDSGEDRKGGAVSGESSVPPGAGQGAMPAPGSLGVRLRDWCRSQGRSMRDLSLAAGCGPKYVGDIISGKSRNPDPRALQRLSSITGLALDRPAVADSRGVVRAARYMDDVITAVEASDLPSKAAIARDLRLFCRQWLRREPAAVPADPYRLRLIMQDWTGARVGVSDKRLANVTSHLNKALQLGATVLVDRRPISSLTPEWQRLWDAIPMEPVPDRQRGGFHAGRNGQPCRRKSWIAGPLSGLMRYCDREAIAPDAVDAAVLERYAEERDRLSLPGYGPKKCKDLRYAWARAVETVPGWPQRPIETPVLPGLNLPLDAFPSSFRADLECYARAAGCRSSLLPEETRLLERARARYQRSRGSTNGRLRDRLAPTTLEAHLDALRFAASVLVRTGERPAEAIRSIADVATIETAALVVDDIEHRLGLETSYAGSLVKMLGSIAERWRDDLDDGERDDFAALRAEAEGLLEKGRMSEKDRRRLAPFMDPAMMQRLVLLPLDLADDCERRRRKGEPVSRSMALAMQAAVICVIEQTLVPRLGTLARTRLDRHIVWPTKNGEPGYLTYDAADTKTGKPLIGQLAPWKIGLIELYVTHYRPILANGPTDIWLFPGDSPARGKSRGALAALSRQVLLQHLGVHVNFHLWRKIVASWLLQETRDPLLVAGLLTHADGSRITRLYAEFQSSWSAAALDQTVERLLDRRTLQLGLGRGRG